MKNQKASTDKQKIKDEPNGYFRAEKSYKKSKLNGWAQQQDGEKREKNQ